jgi:CheY-like chemotaxis protein
MRYIAGHTGLADAPLRLAGKPALPRGGGRRLRGPEYRNMNMPDSAAAPVTVLVVDDEPDMRLLVRAVLERCGIKVVDEAGSGLQVLALLTALPPAPVPTLVLLDNGLPGLSGLDTARRILGAVPDQLILLFTAVIDARIEARAAEIGVPVMSKTKVLDLPGAILRLAAVRSADSTL